MSKRLLNRRFRPTAEQMEDRATPATFTVNTTADTVAVNPATSALDATGKISLRSALQAADANPDADTVILPAGVYNLTLNDTNNTGAETAGISGDLNVNQGSITIQGAGLATTTVQAAFTNGFANRILHVRTQTGAAAQTAVSISGVTMSGGAVNPTTGFTGGGILNEGGAVTLTGVVLQNNAVTVTGVGNATGGGIQNTTGGTLASGQSNVVGMLTLTDTVIQGNTVTGGDSQVQGLGAGIYNASQGSVILTRVRVLNNTATGAPATDVQGGQGQGGGVYDEFGGTLTITDSRFSGNAAVGGASASATADVYGGNGNGGAIYSGFGTSVTITGSTLSGNSAAGGKATSTGATNIAQGGVGQGGGISVSGSLSVINSTISGNTTTGGAASGSTVTNTVGSTSGGGIYFASGPPNGGAQLVSNATITKNSASFGGGVFSNINPGPTFQSTIVAGNLGTDPDVEGVFASGGNNLIGNNQGETTTNNTPTTDFAVANNDIVGTSQAIVDPGLAALADNGGPTFTHALLSTSPAIDKGSNKAALTYDQRGTPYARVVGAAADIGAYESAPPTANSDTYAVPGGTITISTPGVLGNDTGATGLTAVLVNSTTSGTLTLNSDGSFTYAANAGFTGADSFTYQAKDAYGTSSPTTVTLNVTQTTSSGGTGGTGTTGAGAQKAVLLVGGNINGLAKTLNLANGTLTVGNTIPFFPGQGANGGMSDVRTLTADVNGDGVLDTIGGTGSGVITRVVVKDGSNNQVLADFQPFEVGFTGGVFLAAGDFNGDGKADLVVTPDQGGGAHVLIYDGKTLINGTGSPTTIADFNGLADTSGRTDASFRGGIRPAVGDLNGDGVPDLIIAAGFGGGPRVTIWDGKGIAAAVGNGLKPTSNPLANFYAFESTLSDGAYVAAGDITGDGKADLFFGGGPNGGPRVRVADGAKIIAAGNFGSLDAQLGFSLANFYAGNASQLGGVRVAARDLDGDGVADLVTGSGTNQASQVRVYKGTQLRANSTNPSLAQDVLDPFGSVLTDGVFVG